MALNLNYEGFEKYLVKREESLGGVLYKFRFPNNYGASVIKLQGSYGYYRDLWELAVIGFTNPDFPDDSVLVYTTPITDDVIGDLTDAEVRKLLEDIRWLPTL